MNFQGNNPDGSPAPRQKIADYFAISEEKLKALSPEVTKELVDNGFMAVAHAHLISLGNWQRLVNMTLRRSAAEQAAPAKKAPAKKKATAKKKPAAKKKK